VAGRSAVDGSNAQEEVCDWFAGDDLFAPAQRRRGLPIGNQTSQFFANVYLDPLDHFVKERLRIHGYVRYVDDFLIFGNDRRRLIEARSEIGAWLARLRVRLHPDKSVIFPVTQGIPFLGYRVFPTHRLLAKSNVRRFRRRLRSLQRRYARHEIDFAEAYRRIISWIGHARQADTFRLRERLFAEHPFRRASTL
jgi:RNA-directed DNA polymerase